MWHYLNSKVAGIQSEFSNRGEIAVINTDGQWLNRVEVPNYPQIRSMAFAHNVSTLICIESSSNTTMFEFDIKEQTLDKSEKDKQSSM